MGATKGCGDEAALGGLEHVDKQADATPPHYVLRFSCVSAVASDDLTPHADTCIYDCFFRARTMILVKRYTRQERSVQKGNSN